MKTSHKVLLSITGVIAILVVLSFWCCSTPEQKAATNPDDMTIPQMVARGKFLVSGHGCNDCHSPKIMTPQGPIVDSSRLLSGSPADMKLPFIDTSQITPGKWILGNSDFTAWVGPWGVSYAANLTPDSTTGTGGWTEQTFIKIMRGGKFMGIDAGRPIMPPMSVIVIQGFVPTMSDNDLKCIFAYLHSLKPIKNHVHDYVPPPMVSSLN